MNFSDQNFIKGSDGSGVFEEFQNHPVWIRIFRPETASANSRLLCNYKYIVNKLSSLRWNQEMYSFQRSSGALKSEINKQGCAFIR